MELTDEQIERQDFVDNAIVNLLNEINPNNEGLDWNIELIGNVRDCIQKEFQVQGKLVGGDIVPAQEFETDELLEH